MKEIKEIKSFLKHIQPTIGNYAFNEIWQTVETLEGTLEEKLKPIGMDLKAEFYEKTGMQADEGERYNDYYVEWLEEKLEK